MPLDRRAAGANRTRCAMRPIAGDMDIRHGRRRPRETSGTFAGPEGTKKASCIEAETVMALEVVAVAREASPAVRSTDTVTATPSAPNKRPAAHVESDTPRSPQATARQLHRGASRSNAGPNRLRRKTADRPAKLIRTPARAADAAPGAVDPSRSPPATDAPAGLPARRGSWPFPYRNDKNGVVDEARRVRDGSVPVGADGGRLHDIAGETCVVAPARLRGVRRRAGPRRGHGAQSRGSAAGAGRSPSRPEPARRAGHPDGP